MGNQANKFIPPSMFEVPEYLSRKFLFQVLSIGPIPRHVAFILDGNRRYGKKMQLNEGSGHHAGLSNLMFVLRYCYEMGVKYVSVYAFSIDNFKRGPSEVAAIMVLLREEIEQIIKERETVNKLGIKVEFLGDLNLLEERTREAAHKVMAMTSNNSKMVLLVYVAYTSTDEIVRGVRVSCKEKNKMKDEKGVQPLVTMEDIERNMYFGTKPKPDILIRTSGETRLSNFLLWQTSFCFLYAPRCLWPELSLRHIVWAVLEYQRSHFYLEKFKKKF